MITPPLGQQISLCRDNWENVEKICVRFREPSKTSLSVFVIFGGKNIGDLIHTRTTIFSVGKMLQRELKIHTSYAFQNFNEIYMCELIFCFREQMS